MIENKILHVSFLFQNSNIESNMDYIDIQSLIKIGHFVIRMKVLILKIFKIKSFDKLIFDFVVKNYSLIPAKISLYIYLIFVSKITIILNYIHSLPTIKL